jgi:septal ring factor EnvC (AmiA/AmiB activator)
MSPASVYTKKTMSGGEDNDAVRRIADLVAEQLSGQLKVALEALDEIKRQTAKMPAVQDDIAELKSDMKAVKQAIKETNTDLRELDSRVSRLETSAYHA